MSVLSTWTKRAGVTYADVQRAAGLRHATISDIARGVQLPRAETAKKIAAATREIVRRRKLEIAPLTAAQILGVEAA